MDRFQGGGVIDLMNRRLQQRLTEPEILKIFGDVCEVKVVFFIMLYLTDVVFVGFSVSSLLQSSCAASRSQGTIEQRNTVL